MAHGLSVQSFINFVSRGDSAGLEQFLENNHVQVRPKISLDRDLALPRT